MMKKLMSVQSVWCTILSVAVLTLTFPVWAKSEVVDGVTWYYSVLNGKATITSGGVKYTGNLQIPSSLGDSPVTCIGERAFDGCSGLASVTIPASVTSIGNYAFLDCRGLRVVTIFSGVIAIGQGAFRRCSGLTEMTIPPSVTSVGQDAFADCSGLKSLIISEGVTSIGNHAFDGCSGLASVTIPASVTSIGSGAFLNCSRLNSIEYIGRPPSGTPWTRRPGFPREYGAEWLKLVGIGLFPGYGQPTVSNVEIVSAAIREDDPTVMDVVYKAKSVKPTVKVRALAFQDGERSFAKVVRPTEFIDDTAKNIGDAIAANEEHKLSWRVSADWKVDLAKVKFEVLASAGDLLPLELTTIPKTANHASMEISWNAIYDQQVLDALFWLYADGDAGLTLEGGVLKNGTTQLAKDASLAGSYSYYGYPAIVYIFSKMGFSVLSSDELQYANELTRLGLSPDGVRQHAYRMVEE